MESSESVAALQRVVQHVFLPPHLPSGQDNASFIPTLIPLILSSLQEFQTFQDEKAAGLVKRAIVAVENFQKSQTQSGGISEKRLKDLFNALKYRGMS